MGNLRKNYGENYHFKLGKALCWANGQMYYKTHANIHSVHPFYEIRIKKKKLLTVIAFFHDQ